PGRTRGSAPTTIIIFFLLAGCGDSLGRFGSYRFGDDLTQDRVGEPDEFKPEDAGDTYNETTDAGISDEDIELEEMEMEGAEDLAALIHDRLESDTEEATGDTWSDSKTPRKPTQIPNAYDNWKLSSKQCLKRIKSEGVRFKKAGFETPLVETPLLLEGPIRGVEITPRWPQFKNMNAVMDCHLVLALIELSSQARSRGIEKIHFYSTYRPIRVPPDRCKFGKKGSRCRRLKKAYKKAKKKPSQHRTALAIDIRWFVTKEGETIDVLEDFDRRSRRDPCSYTARGSKARLLQDLACALHRDRIFNVMLTPNANKAHHNHFHFDITPDAKWYIIR
ncbi:MAG: hypothetical protein GY854_26210, partial [Deltaproteobacteria bacterium]|nr:hypothetical protein [Deltaproteobacteria bacterium]